ncbi:hypothetical protein [Paenibacillus pinihumi]|uniref:hypothetical protein n=1 Tax=Paenibacillus pinihumi TaxID=669462 RepID=UPI0004907414|nr:hypothetical protein [Paenibacillus pinihumi]
MIPAEIKVQLDPVGIREFVQQELQKQIRQQLLLVDINRLSELTSMSPKFLETEILHDPRVRIHERRKLRKRWWVAQPTFEAILVVIEEW